MTPAYWEGYSNETPYPVGYPGTSAVDADSDGTARSMAPTTRLDDVPNIMELSCNTATCRSRTAASGSAALPAPRTRRT
jgi:hypothetical protein